MATQTITFASMWSAEAQITFLGTFCYPKLANFESVADIKNAKILNKDYIQTAPTARLETARIPTAARTYQSYVMVNDTLTVNSTPQISWKTSAFDALQLKIPIRAELRRIHTHRLGQYMEGVFTAEIANASTVLDALDVDPSLGSAYNNVGISIAESNIPRVIGLADDKLILVTKSEVNKRKYMVVGPMFLGVLKRYIASRVTGWGDETGKNGMIGRYWGYDIYLNPFLYYTTFLSMATQPLDGDTLSISVFQDAVGVTTPYRTVTIRFKTTIAAAGDVLIGATLATALANLNSLLNSTVADNTSSTQYWSFLEADKNVMNSVTGTINGASTGTTITIKGYGGCVVSDTLTAAADGFTSNLQIEHQMFGIEGGIDMAVQSGVQYEQRQDPDNPRVMNNFVDSLFITKTWMKNARKQIDVYMDFSGVALPA